MLRSSYPGMKRVAKSILDHDRSFEAESDLLSIKEILNLIPGTTIIYSSHLLVHRQISSTMRRLSVKKQHKKKTDIYIIQPNKYMKNDSHEEKYPNNTFINISAYFNKRLYENIKKSLTRIQNNRNKETFS